MSVGDYVRTRKGITKIIDIRDELTRNSMNGNEVVIETNIIITDNGLSVSNDYKSSLSILELLEPMDLLYIDISPDDCGGIVVPRIPETLDELEKYIEKIKSGEYILKYVVTHEQLKNNMYKVGE